MLTLLVKYFAFELINHVIIQISKLYITIVPGDTDSTPCRDALCLVCVCTSALCFYSFHIVYYIQACFTFLRQVVMHWKRLQRLSTRLMTGKISLLCREHLGRWWIYSNLILLYQILTKYVYISLRKCIKNISQWETLWILFKLRAVSRVVAV